MKIPDDELLKLKLQVPIWRYLLEHKHPLDFVSGEYRGKCPLPEHRDRTPSFTVFKQDDGTWTWKCFGCAKSGNIFQLISAIEKCKFTEAVETVKKMAGEQTSWTKEQEHVEKVFHPMVLSEKHSVTFPLSNMKSAETALAETPEAVKWLKDRGITLETAANFHVGFVRSAAKVSPNHPWVNDGWLLLPTYVGGTITSLKYRSLKGKHGENGTTGFLRVPDMSTTLYNLDDVTPFDDIYVVEGEPDAMILSQAGYNVVAMPSASYKMSPEERSLLVSAKRIFLAGDTDSVGRAAMLQLWREFGAKTFYIEWEEAKDANDYYLKSPETFGTRLEALRDAAIGKPIPFVFDLRDSLLHADDTSPMDNPARLFFPWPTIDKWTAILPSDVMAMFASETGMGKTTWLMALLLENAMRGKVVVNYSAELSPDQYARRAASYLTGADRQTLTKADFQKAAAMLKDVKFYNGYQPGAGIKDVLQLIIEAKKHLGADVVAIDHLHFLTRGSKDEVALQNDAMKALKEFARDYGVIVIVVGQPRKASGGQARGRIVQTQDAKGGETFGSDSSAVFIIHRDREEGGDDDRPVFSNVTKIILDKSRESETAQVRLLFVGKKCRFNEMTPSQIQETEETDL